MQQSKNLGQQQLKPPAQRPWALAVALVISLLGVDFFIGSSTVLGALTPRSRPGTERSHPHRRNQKEAREQQQAREEVSWELVAEKTQVQDPRAKEELLQQKLEADGVEGMDLMTEMRFLRGLRERALKGSRPAPSLYRGIMELYAAGRASMGPGRFDHRVVGTPLPRPSLLVIRMTDKSNPWSRRALNNYGRLMLEAARVANQSSVVMTPEQALFRVLKDRGVLSEYLNRCRS